MELLTGSSGDKQAHAKHAAVVKLAQKKISLHKAAAATTAKAGNSLKQAIVSADSRLQMTHTAQSYKEEEVTRADAIEKKLLGEI